MNRRTILPRHKRVNHPPRMRLTERDMQILLAVHGYRVLRRDQVQSLLFPSRNTTNERLKRLYQHGFLERRWLPVEYGQGMGQALYLLGRRGAELIAEREETGQGTPGWKESHNLVSSPFLQHTLMINDVRIAITLAAREAGYRVESWMDESELKAMGEYVYVTAAGGRSKRVAVIPDGYLVLNLGRRWAHFFLEIDRGTVSNRRWRERIQAYLRYVGCGKYAARFGTRSLRVLTVTTGVRRMTNLKRITEEAGGRVLFWFTTLEKVTPARVLTRPVWAVAGEEAESRLIG